MWSRGHVLGGRVTAATRLWFPDFAMRWGFGRPGVRGDRRDLSTGMSGGAGVGLPRLGVSGNGNAGWGSAYLLALSSLRRRVETPPVGDRPRQASTGPSMAKHGCFWTLGSGLEWDAIGPVPLPKCASLCGSASRTASRPRQPAQSLVGARGAPSRPRRHHWSTSNRLHGRIPNRPSAPRHGNDGRQGSGASSTCQGRCNAKGACMGRSGCGPLGLRQGEIALGFLIRDSTPVVRCRRLTLLRGRA